MTINQIINKVEIINTNSKYRFIRTEKGTLFEQFTNENHIAIGWDYITINMFKSATSKTIKERIAKAENINLDSSHGKSISTSLYNKIAMFLDLSKGDFVICPSKNSDRLAFGQIIDDVAYEDTNAQMYIKRRNVKWIKIVHITDLNPIFYQVKSNHHSISNINKYAPHIDRVIGNLFEKEGNTHYVFNVGKEDDISFDELNDLMDNIKLLLAKINSTFSLDESQSELYIKINLQSKGTLELIKSGKSLAILAFFLSLSSCTDNSRYLEDDLKINEYINENRELLEKTSQSISSLRINTDELTKPFENGN